MRQREKTKEVDERDRRTAELRTSLEADAATLRRAQKAIEAERAALEVCASPCRLPAILCIAKRHCDGCGHLYRM